MPNPEEPLVPKDVVSIKQLDINNLLAMKASHLEKLTHNFDERYAKIVMSKAKNPQEQRKILDALKKAFDSCHYVPSGWGDEYYYNCPVPPYLDEKGWDYLLTVYGNILFEEEKGNPQLAEIAPIPAPTLSEMLTEEGLLNNWIASSTRNLETTLNGAKKDTEDMLNQLKTLRDGSLTRMQDKMTDAENKMNVMQLELDTLRQWHAAWERVRQAVLDTYDPADIAEVGGLDDPTAMADAVEAFMAGYQSEKRLEEENERLRQNQEKWRESKEYLAEKKKWETMKVQSIAFEDIKKRLLEHAKTFTDGAQLQNFLLNFNAALSGTMWMNYAYDTYSAVMSTFNETHTPIIRPERMEVETLKAEQVNDIHNNNTVNFDKDGSKG